MTDTYTEKTCPECEHPFDADTDNRLCPDCNRDYDRLDGAMTQEAAHTPAPWIQEGASVYALTPNTASSRTRVPLVNRFHLSVQRTNGEDGAGQEEVEANARLIAAAPSMLAALEAARSFLLMAGERTHEPLLRSVFYEKVDDLDRVLAQARGEKVQGG